MNVSDFIRTYLYHALGTAPKEVKSLMIDGKTEEAVYARAKYESPEGEIFWITVQRVPSDVP